MSSFLLLLASLELTALVRGERKDARARSACLGGGLLLGALRGGLAPGCGLDGVLEWTSLLILALALVLAYRDGTLRRVFLPCREARAG